MPRKSFQKIKLTNRQQGWHRRVHTHGCFNCHNKNWRWCQLLPYNRRSTTTSNKGLLIRCSSDFQIWTKKGVALLFFHTTIRILKQSVKYRCTSRFKGELCFVFTMYNLRTILSLGVYYVLFIYTGYQYLSPLTLRVGISLMRGVLDTTLWHKVCQRPAAGRRLSPCTPVSSTNKTDDITEMLLKVALNTTLII